VSAVAASADNDAWAATGAGKWVTSTAGGGQTSGSLSPHLYQYTDGQPPNAPSGANANDDQRLSLFTLSPPVYQVISPVVKKAPTKHKTIKKKLRPKHLPPAIFGIRTKLGPRVHGVYTLHLLFRVRRPVTVGLAVLHDKRIVARTSLKRFNPGIGELSVHINRAHWPTSLKLLTPPAKHTSR
jgi:hypothetical protein